MNRSRWFRVHSNMIIQASLSVISLTGYKLIEYLGNSSSITSKVLNLPTMLTGSIYYGNGNSYRLQLLWSRALETSSYITVIMQHTISWWREVEEDIVSAWSEWVLSNQKVLWNSFNKPYNQEHIPVREIEMSLLCLNPNKQLSAFVTQH